MATTNRTNSFVIIFSIVFVASFFVIRVIFDKIGWAHAFELAISLLVSGIVATLSTPLLVSKNRRTKGVLFLGVYFIVLFGIIALKPENLVTDIKTGDVWVTRESDGEDFVLDFFKKDSVRLVLPPNNERVVGYLWNGKELQLYDEEDGLLFDWEIELGKKTLTVLQGKDKLVFYKQ
jgi:hypothetical protein